MVPKGRQEEGICINIITWPAQLVNEKLENNARVRSLSTDDVVTPLVPYIMNFVSSFELQSEVVRVREQGT